MAITTQAAFNISDSLREDFSNIITNIDPTERPFQANIGTTGIDNPDEYSWQIDSLDAADASNAFEDGAVYEATGAVNDASEPSRIRNRCQISRRHVSVSRRSMKADKAGMGNNLSYQLVRRGQEVLRDREKVLLTPNVAVQASSGTAPELASLPVWLKTNTHRESGGSDPTLSSGFPAITTLDGTTPVALTEANLLEVMGSIYDNSSSGGGNQMIMVGRKVKQRISAFLLSGNSRSATQYQQQGASPRGGAQVLGAVDFYVSDFKVASIVPNRFQRERDVFILDKDLFELGVFDDMEIVEQGVDGDKQDHMLLTDYTLISRDESGSGVVADVDETVAMTV